MLGHLKLASGGMARARASAPCSEAASWCSSRSAVPASSSGAPPCEAAAGVLKNQVRVRFRCSPACTAVYAGKPDVPAASGLVPFALQRESPLPAEGLGKEHGKFGLRAAVRLVRPILVDTPGCASKRVGEKPATTIQGAVRI